jgi:hypothetical protein
VIWAGGLNCACVLRVLYTEAVYSGCNVVWRYDAGGLLARDRMTLTLSNTKVLCLIILVLACASIYL